MADMHPQLPLKLSRRPNTDFDSFVASGNEQLVSRLRNPIQGFPIWHYVWGGQETGKSHLLQATCHSLEDAGNKVFYLDAQELLSLPADILLELRDYDLVAIDDLHLLMEHRQWEEALFHLYNQLRDGGRGLLVSAECAPRYLTCNLADLASRLSAMEIYQLQGLDEDAKACFLKRAAEQRGFSLSDEVVTYVLSRSDRSMNALQGLLERLDLQSLQEKRLITVPFVKKVMAW